jgi:hypothetical protein
LTKSVFSGPFGQYVSSTFFLAFRFDQPFLNQFLQLAPNFSRWDFSPDPAVDFGDPGLQINSKIAQDQFPQAMRFDPFQGRRAFEIQLAQQSRLYIIFSAFRTPPGFDNP